MPEPRPPKQEQEPAGSEVTEVAPGVLRMQLPIEMPGLGHVNCYVLQDDRGVAIVDPGLPGAATWAALQQRLGQAGLKPADVHTVIVTHSHPDHFGTAGKVVEETGATLVAHSAFHTWWGEGEHRHDDARDDARDDVRHGAHDVDPEDLARENPFEGDTTPWGGERMQRPRALDDEELLQSYVPPKVTRRVRDGEVLRLAGRDLFASYTPGHTLDHLCLHDPEAGLLFSGDHVLPTITPHISGLGTGRDPVTAFVASLDKVAALADVKLVLPAHGHPFADLAGRANDIKRHHEERLEQLREASLALGPTTVTELSHQLFRPARWGPMAESETFAHLEHLRLAGLLERRQKDGQYIYEAHAT